MPTNQEMIYNSIKVALKIHGLQLDTIDLTYLPKKEMKDPKALSYIDPETFEVIFNQDLVEKATDRRPLIIESFHIVRHYVQRAYVKFNRWATDIPKFEKNLIPRWRADFRLQDDPNKIKRKPEFYQKLDSEIDAKAFGYIIALHEFGFVDTLPELTKDEILERALELEYEFGYKERPEVIETVEEEKEEINPNDDLYVIETDENGMLVYRLRKRSDDEILVYGSDGSDSMTDDEKKRYEESLNPAKQKKTKLLDEDDENDSDIESVNEKSKDDAEPVIDTKEEEEPIVSEMPIEETEEDASSIEIETIETESEDENTPKEVEVEEITIEETDIENTEDKAIEEPEIIENEDVTLEDETKENEPIEASIEEPVADNTPIVQEKIIEAKPKKEEDDIPVGSIAQILSKIKKKQLKVTNDDDILEYEMEEIEEYM